MGRRDLYQTMINGDLVPAADVTKLKLPAVTSAVSSYVTAKYAVGAMGVRVILTLAACPLTLVKNGTTSAGAGVSILTFPKGYIKPFGATGALTVNGVDATYVVALGSAAAGTDGALSSTEVTFAPSTSSVVSSGKVDVTFVQDIGTALDGTGTAVQVYLNGAINADGTGKEALTVSGTINLFFCNLS